MNRIGTAFAILAIFFCLALPCWAQGAEPEGKYTPQSPTSVDAIYQGQEFAASCRKECADSCKSPDTNVTCADCVSGCIKKRVKEPEEKPEKESSILDSDFKIDEKDRVCAADGDCAYLSLVCETCCGAPVVALNRSMSDKYVAKLTEACRNYQYSNNECMCQPPEVACMKGRCVMSQGWGGQKLEDEVPVK